MIFYLFTLFRICFSTTFIWQSREWKVCNFEEELTNWYHTGSQNVCKKWLKKVFIFFILILKNRNKTIRYSSSCSNFFFLVNFRHIFLCKHLLLRTYIFPSDTPGAKLGPHTMVLIWGGISEIGAHVYYENSVLS